MKDQTIENINNEIIRFDSYEDIKSYAKEYLTKTNKKNNKSPKKESNDISIKVFIKNAHLLKNVDSTVLKKTKIFHFSKNIIQYYVLTEARLIAYFGFRTQVRNGVIPTINKFNEFLLIYLMEIVNGVYGDTYDEKRNILDNILFLADEKKSYKELIVEAYEILYFQYSRDLELASYITGVSVSIFDGYKFVDKKYKNVYEPTADHLFKELGPYLTSSYDKDGKSMLKACFDHVYYELNEDDSYSISGQSIKEIFAFESDKISNSPLSKIKTLYPADITFFFVDNYGVFHSIKKGVHSNEIYFHSYRRKMIIEYVLESIMKSIEKFCSEGESYSFDTNDYDAFIGLDMIDRIKSSMFGDLDPEEMQELVDNAVNNWVSTDYDFLEELYDLPFDMIDEWIEDHPFDPTTIAPRVKIESSVDKKESSKNNPVDDIITPANIKRFVHRLSESEFGVLCIFLDLSNCVTSDDDIINNPYIIDQVNSINTKSSKILKIDVITKNKIVNKYKNMLVIEILN